MVAAQYVPPFGPICAWILDPAGGRGVYAVNPNGNLYCMGAPATTGYTFTGHTAARLLPPTSAQRADGKLVVIEATNGDLLPCPPD